MVAGSSRAWTRTSAGGSATRDARRPCRSSLSSSDIVRAWVYADGRIIWDRRPFHGKGGIPQGANEFTSGYLEQRLAPEGVELVRAAVAELFDRSRTLVVTIPAQEELWTGIANVRSALFVPTDDADNTGIVAVPDGDRHARLHVRGIVTKNDHAGGRLVGEIVEGTLATPEQLSALRRVHALLTDPASVLPSSAWAEQKVRAYVPSHYAVCIDSSPPKDASELLSLLPARAADVLRDKSRTRRDGEPYGSLYPDGPMGVLGSIGRGLLQAGDRGGSRGRRDSLRARVRSGVGDSLAGVSRCERSYLVAGNDDLL